MLSVNFSLNRCCGFVPGTLWELCTGRAKSYLNESVVLLQSFDVKTSLLSKIE